ncbi:MAG: PH domain-containing protein [Candidatus Cloacimonetes bacterium]|nr:PH domain-containing protein [Candidatus Cloacimonadota bacterium]MCF7815314.1 PH domain-containing protein [Candidatus Cloacimonadota bacterium]MCF7869428.1 PH domain-containing protein [Candidatus Cloacimonadota bacterium]MCF7884825.1 PH domain-containing protein [Candidatus Cloacimonadota bacterium]
MEFKPSGKLITKSWLNLISITLLIVVIAFVLYLFPALDSEIDFAEFIHYLWWITFLLILAMWLISAPIMILWIKNLSYSIEDDRIVIHKGILTKIKQNIPFRMITDFMLERSLYDRWLGIGSIKIQTAGQSQNSSGYEGKLSGLMEWDKMHEELRAKLAQTEKSVEKSVQEPKGSLAEILTELKKISRILEERKK